MMVEPSKRRTALVLIFLSEVFQQTSYYTIVLFEGEIHLANEQVMLKITFSESNLHLPGIIGHRFW